MDEESKEKIAGEYFCGLVSILKLCDFSDDEICELFDVAIQAIQEQKSDSKFSALIYEHIKKTRGYESLQENDDPLYLIEAEFQKTSTYNDLFRLQKRLEATATLEYSGVYEDEQWLEKVFKLFIELADLDQKAREEIKKLCQKYRIKFVECKNLWWQDATSDDIDEEDSIFFYGETINLPTLKNDSCFVDKMVDQLCFDDNLDKLNFLKENLSKNSGMGKEKNLAIIERGIFLINFKEAFLKWIKSYFEAKTGGYYESAFIDDATNNFKELLSRGEVQSLLKNFEKKSIIERTKQKNRWWVQFC